MRNIGFYVGSLASFFAKRIMSSSYDMLAQRPFVRNLRQRSPAEKLAAEALLYGVGSIIDAHLGETGAMRKFAKEMANDGISGIGSRLHSDPPNRASDLWRLAELSEEQLDEFLDWYTGKDSRTREAIRRAVTRQTASQISRMLALPPSHRERLVQMSMTSTPLFSRTISWMDALSDRIERLMVGRP